jgi:hypothetical protein
LSETLSFDNSKLLSPNDSGTMQPLHKKKDHIEENKIWAADYKGYKDKLSNFKKSVLSKNNAVNLELIKLQKNQNELMKRNHDLLKLNKWQDFRERKAAAIKKYLQLKRNQQALNKLCMQVFLYKIIKKLQANYKAGWEEYEKHCKKQFVYLMISNRWRQRRSRFG